MAFKFILLLMPALSIGSIDIDISGNYSGDAKDLKLYYGGKDISIISDAERITFNVTETNLKNAVTTYMGNYPYDAFVRRPTGGGRYGDLYSKYDWKEVSRTLVPRRGKILKASSQPTVVVNRTFENNGTKRATYNVGISQSVVNTVSSSWNTDGELSVERKIYYDINIKNANVGGQTSFSYVSSWGQNTQQSQAVIVGASSDMDVTLEPGEAIVARLEATRVVVQVEIEYEASLSGQTAVTYAITPAYHLLYGLRIESCMRSAGLSNLKRSREVIEIKIFSESMVVVSDLHYGNNHMKASF